MAAAGGKQSKQQQLASLRKVDERSEELQREGKLLEALQCMEKSLILRGHVFGVESAEVHKACKAVAEMCNYLAMIYLQQDEMGITLELLKKAEALTERHRAVRAVTYNNLGCYYRKRGKLRTAQGYLDKALAIEGRLQDSVKVADTHLNMCTVLSELGEHKKALQHARTALKLLNAELFDGKEGGPEGEGAGAGGEEKKEEQGEGDERGEAKLPVDRVAVLAIAYHNLAVQQEFLKQYKESMASYSRAADVIREHGGEDHPLAKSLGEARNAAHKKLKELIQKQQQQQAKRGRSRTASSATGAGLGGLDDTEEDFAI